ncbi:hypothetical protein DBR32_08120 [Taibaiella sp. KBW10]|uniref:hypothetical protein n=1 Tax=Taibaiella sp. KBW10 TaxID=2153357 RepID=UPI000F598178|nr:hypothetical protein [Taibaiella sp. KBW10]RQO30688.1 hypothetical protein DBR32_08120 [Taibaiella sp. KBW10]
MSDFPPITPEEARDLTSTWRTYFAQSLGIEDPNSTDIFRGFRIPLVDLKNIMEDIDYYNAQGGDINSIRVYLAKNNLESNDANDIHVLLLPIDGGEPMGNGETNEYPFGKDVLQMRRTVSSPVTSTIYDFTTPCPKQCDVSSPLYATYNPL